MTEPPPGMKPGLALLMPLLWAAALVLPAFGAQAAAVLTSLHSFQVATNGKDPSGALVQGSDGSFYGTTYGGGTNGWGTVFKISTNGALTSLYSFTGGDDGAYPEAGLVQGRDGYFYGTTYYGGTSGFGLNGYGTVFQVSTNGVLTSLYSFTGGDDGAYPRAGLAQGNDGNFYGTTCDIGLGSGTVFQVSTNGALTSLYSFTGGDDGANPNELEQTSDGYFYGTTQSGGANDNGTVFRISTNGTLTNLYSFTGGSDGGNPMAGLVQGNDGYLYGTTSDFNPQGFFSGHGTVFKISTNGALITLYSFTGGNDGLNDGVFPSGLVQGTDGYFYGATENGGTYTNQYGLGNGTVFQISTNGALTNLYSFTGGNDGAYPDTRLVQGRDGSFYGATPPVGTNNFGTVFKVSTNGAFTSLCSFTGVNDGAYPQAGLVQGNDGYFYGTTRGLPSGYGTVFKIRTDGALTNLYSFTGGNDGAGPQAGLVQGSDGYFYGTTSEGGTNGRGTVFRISTAGALTSLYSFTGGNDGASPIGGLVQGSDGYFYGTTPIGGTNGWGTVFRISTNGTLTNLYSFTGGSDGGNPMAGLVQGNDGYFYGTTYGGPMNGYGTVFRISTTGALTNLYSFTGTNDGWYPNGLVQGRDGYFYGTTSRGGGTNANGTVFKMSTTGALTNLYSFTGLGAGVGPAGGLVQGSDDYFYGTTSVGGTSAYGTVFQISTNGALTSLYSFTGGNDGSYPGGGLVQGNNGSFYGTTSGGGVGGAGTLFRLTIVPAFQAVALTSRTLNLTWSTEAGGTYQLQYNSPLSSSNWTNLGSAVTAAGATLNASDSITNGPRRLYRVVLSP